MLGLGIPEMVLIMVAALLIFGPKRLPEIGQSVGKAMREFKKGVNDIKDNFENVIPEDLMSDEAKVDGQSPVSASTDASNLLNVAEDNAQATQGVINATSVSVDENRTSQQADRAVDLPDGETAAIPNASIEADPKA